MNRPTYCMLVLALLSLLSAAWAKQEGMASAPLHLAIDLVDGSHIIGVPNIRSVPTQTSYATIDIALDQILNIEIGEDHETASLELENGDKLKGVLDLKPMELETVFGKVIVGMQHITTVRVTKGIISSQGLVLRYSFDKDEGDTITDKSLEKNTAKVQGAKWTTLGKVGGAYEFDGIDDYVALPSNILTGQRQVTIVAWIKVTNTSMSKYIYLRYGQSAADQFYVQADTLRVVFDVRSSQGGWTAVTTNPLSENTWHHVAIVYDALLPVANKVTIYVDGQRASDPAIEARGGSGALGVNQEFLSSPLLPGRTDTTSGRFKGRIDEVMVFNRALTETDIKQVYNFQK